MRPLIADITSRGTLPSEEEATDEELESLTELLEQVPLPLTDEEALALAQTFGPDDCYGLAWTVLHMVETAPHALTLDHSQVSSPWRETLVERQVGSDEG